MTKQDLRYHSISLVFRYAGIQTCFSAQDWEVSSCFPAMSRLGLSYFLLSVAWAADMKSRHTILADGQIVRRDIWQPSSQTDSIPKESGVTWPNPVAVSKKDEPKEPKGKGSAVGPNNLKEAEAEVTKFFKIEAMVANETGLPLNSSSAAEKEMDEESRKKEEDQEEEAERVDLLYASMIVCLILVAALAYYRYRQAQDPVPTATVK